MVYDTCESLIQSAKEANDFKWLENELFLLAAISSPIDEETFENSDELSNRTIVQSLYIL